MSTEYIRLDWMDVLLAALLLLVNVGASAALKLGLTRTLLWAAARMTAQLLLVGLVLEWVFALRRPAPVIAIAVLMAAVAAVTAVHRGGRRFVGAYANALVSVLGGAFLVTAVAALAIVDAEPWYEPQYLIPMLGMVLGNALNGVSLGLERFTENLVRMQGCIEADLAVGATRWEAVHGEVRDAVRTGMVPITNAMLIMGVVSLPGMMTGQILAGAAPADAVLYQIVIVFMIAAAVAVSTVTIVLLAYRRLLDGAHRLRLDRLREG